jgi:ParB/RepB/Spo0J family partition protein
VTAAYTERSVPLTELGDRLAALRLFDATALASMRWSLSTHGQLSPLFAFKGGEGLEVYDGFKRLRAARGLGLRELRTVVMEVDIVEATVHMRELHAGRGLTALEEAWIVRSLHREHHLSQGAIATRLRCHKSWVCRRLMLVEALDTSVQADVRLGLLTPRAAVLVSALPRGNQSVASGAVIRRGLTVRQTAAFVRELADAADADAEQAVLSRWTEALPAAAAGGGVHASRGVAETIARDIMAIRRSAGRLEACLTATPLASLSPAPGASSLVRESLGELGGVLRALAHTIAGALTQPPLAPPAPCSEVG